MGKLIDVTGKRFNRLTVINRDVRPTGNVFWKCLCDCGKTVFVDSANLRKGHTKSCGCYNAESIKTRSKTHGMFGTSEYRSWSMMLTRCENPRSKKYPSYGGRGITVCAEWHSFEEFFKSMGYKPTEKHSIDRIDVDGNYEPSNCRWATPSEQSRNLRKTIRVTIGTETKCIKEWAMHFGVKYATAVYRYHRGAGGADQLFGPSRK